MQTWLKKDNLTLQLLVYITSCTLAAFLKQFIVIKFPNLTMEKYYTNIFTRQMAHTLYIQGVPGGMCETSGECS